MTLSLLERAQIALNTTGWRTLGTFPAGFDLREFDIVYSADDQKYYLFSTYPADTGIVYYSGATLEELATSPYTVVAPPGMEWYPSVTLDHGTWYVFGTDAPGNTGWITSSTTPPVSWSGLQTISFLDSPGGQIDACLRLVNFGGTNYWIMVSISQDQGGGIRQLLRIYRHAATMSTGAWTRLLANNTDIFVNIGVPDFASVANPDPNFMAVGGRYYVGFVGRDDAGKYTSALVEVSLTGNPPTGGKAINPIVQVSSEYTGALWSDLCFLSCPDGVDRIFGSGFGAPTWACLDLPADTFTAAIDEPTTAAYHVGMATGRGNDVAMVEAQSAGVSMAAAIGEDSE